MLNFDEELTPSAQAGLRMATLDMGPAVTNKKDEKDNAVRPEIFRPHPCGRQAHHQQQLRREPAGAVQVQMGVGEIPGRQRQPLDAARDQHVGRHCPVEEPERTDR